jgi:hypothetical protein
MTIVPSANVETEHNASMVPVVSFLRPAPVDVERTKIVKPLIVANVFNVQRDAVQHPQNVQKLASKIAIATPLHVDPKRAVRTVFALSLVKIQFLLPMQEVT